MTEKDKTLKKIVCLLISLLICVCITGLFFSAEASLGVYRHSNVRNAINQSGYKDNAYKNFYKEYKSLLTGSGFKMKAAGQAFSERQFLADCESSISASLKGGSPAVDASDSRALLNRNLRKALTESGVAVTGSTGRAIDKISRQAAGYYKSNVEFTFGSYYYEARKATMDRLGIMAPMMMVLMVVGAAVLFMLNKRRHRAYRYLLFAAAGAVIPEMAVYIRLSAINGRMPLGTAGYYSDFVGKLCGTMTAPFVFWIAGNLIVIAALYIMVRNERKYID